MLSLLCFSFFYAEKIAMFMRQKDPLYVSIETMKDDYKEDYVNAIIEDDYIIPGLMGKEIDVEKSFQSVDINSRKELEDIAEEEKLDINFNNWWDRWNELVQQTKQDIKEELKGFEMINTNPVYVYDILKQRVIKTFKSPKECAKYYNISRELVNTYIRDHRVYYKQAVEFRQ